MCESASGMCLELFLKSVVVSISIRMFLCLYRGVAEHDILFVLVQAVNIHARKSYIFLLSWLLWLCFGCCVLRCMYVYCSFSQGTVVCVQQGRKNTNQLMTRDVPKGVVVLCASCLLRRGNSTVSIGTTTNHAKTSCVSVFEEGWEEFSLLNFMFCLEPLMRDDCLKMDNRRH